MLSKFSSVSVDSSISSFILHYCTSSKKGIIAYANFTSNTKSISTANMTFEKKKNKWVEGLCISAPHVLDIEMILRFLCELRTNPFYSFPLLSSMFNSFSLHG